MEIFLIRHAPAVPRAPRQPDASRPLSPEGRESFARVARGLTRLGVRFDRLYHSPWLRAVQTADLLLPLCDQESVVCPGLARAPAPALLSELRGERVGLVGHEPWLSELLSWLAFGSTAHARGLELKKGGLARLRGEPRPGAMTLLSLLPPKLLRAVR